VGYLAEINDLVLTAFLNFDDEIKSLTNDTQKTTTHIALQRLIKKWTLVVTLHSLPSEYNTIKAIIQDWTSIDIEKAKSHIRKHKLELKDGLLNTTSSDQLLYAHNKGDHQQGQCSHH
jgi:hypothetical protein